MKKAFKTQPFDYLLKPVDPDELAETLLRFQNQFNKKPLPESKSASEKIILISAKGTEIISPADVVYFEYNSRKTILHLADGSSLETTSSLRQVYEKLENQDLLQISKNTFINFGYVSVINSHYITLKHGNMVCELIAGRTFLTEIRKKLGLE